MITQQDRDDYGDQLIAFSRRAALDALGPEVRALQQENQHLQGRLRQQVRHNLEQQLDRSVPGWRQVYDDPNWRAWLDAPDDYSGQSRRELINRAAEAGDVHRVAAFFRQPPASQPAYRARSRQPATGGPRVYSRQEIAALYERRRKGGIDDARWAQIEADIVKAASEGRINSMFDKYGNETRFR
jgi:hypothetical protein